MFLFGLLLLYIICVYVYFVLTVNWEIEDGEKKKKDIFIFIL